MFTGINANVPNSRQVKTHGFRRENARTRSVGSDFQTLLDQQDRSGNWFREPLPASRNPGLSYQLILCIDHSLHGVHTGPPG